MADFDDALDDLQALWDAGDPQAPEGFKDWGQGVVDTFGDLRDHADLPSRASARTSSVSIPDNSTTAVSFQTNPWTHGLSNTTSGAGIDIDEPGIYLATFTVQWESSNDGIRRVELQVDGTIVARSQQQAAAFSNDTVSAQFVVEEDDLPVTVAARVLQTSGGSLDLEANSRSPILAVTRLQRL